MGSAYAQVGGTECFGRVSPRTGSDRIVQTIDSASASLLEVTFSSHFNVLTDFMGSHIPIDNRNCESTIDRGLIWQEDTFGGIIQSTNRQDHYLSTKTAGQSSLIAAYFPKLHISIREVTIQGEHGYLNKRERVRSLLRLAQEAA